jgi:hypothetical protein
MGSLGFAAVAVVALVVLARWLVRLGRRLDQALAARLARRGFVREVRVPPWPSRICTSRAVSALTAASRRA